MSKDAWIKHALSDEQYGPFARKSQNASILAAAGAGKTRTLVHLVAADLVAGIPPTSIIAFTFTEKAAQELLARIHALAAQHIPNTDITGLYTGTIHGWCLQYLRSQSDYYNISSVDELHVDALVSRLYDLLAIETTYGLKYPRGIKKFIADLEILYNEHLPIEQVPKTIKRSIENFIDTLHKNRLMTFGDMIRAATFHLNSNGPVPVLNCVYVDEYQDVNPAQVALIKALASPSTKIAAVGDDLQCIYQWRGSDVRRILNFTSEFKDASVHRLPTNYRSRPEIVKVANTIANAISIKDTEKEMSPGREDSDGPVVHWLSYPSDAEQAQAAAEIVQRYADKGVPWKSMAVLLRSVNSWGKDFVDEFTRRQIPSVCPRLSRGGAFINEVALPLLNWLRQEHPEPKNEVEERNAEAAANSLWASAKPWVKATDPEIVFWTAVNEWLDMITEQKSDAYDIRGRFYDLLNQCQIHIRTNDASLMVGLGIASQIIRSVEEMHRRRIAGQQRRTPRGVVSEVYHALLRRNQDFGESLPIEQVGDGVLISTVHQAKGLEWPIVILPALVERRFPVAPSSHGTSFPDKIAARYGTTIEDECRLFYVAATRARERLFLLDPVSQKPQRRSSFLRDLDTKGYQPHKSIAEIPDGVWRIHKDDLQPQPGPPIRIGLSELLLYTDCPLQYGLRHIVGLQPSIGEELGYGQSLHELIQRRLDNGKPWSPTELETECKKHVFLPYMSEGGEAKSRAAISARLTQLESLDLLSGKVETEIDIQVALPGGIVHGIIDIVLINPDGTLTVRDWKSSLHDEFLLRYYRQLQFYVFALRQKGRQVKAADIVDVAASSKAARLVTKAVDISDATTKPLITVLSKSLRGIAESEFPAKPSKSACATCDMHRLCGERITK
jgi:DNA helicase II / ATP-dependent DNA helicase PcrA